MNYFKCLQVNDRVGVVFCNNATHIRTFLHDNISENFSCILLTLVMAYDCKLNLLFLSEELMITHFARNKGVSASR